MAINLKDAENMIKAANNNNVILGVIFQNRYNPGSKLIKDYLKEEKLGKFLSGKLEVTWDHSDEYYRQSDWKGTWDKEGGGVIIDQAIHTLDLMRWFINEDIEYIDSTICNRKHNVIEVEDSAEGVIKYKNGEKVISDKDINENFDYGNGIKGYWGTSHKKQINNFYDSLKMNIKPHIVGEEALKTQKMICGIYESGKKEIQINF